jgi:hypothetical protein
MNAPRKSQIPSSTATNPLSGADYIRQAVEICERYSIIPGVSGPYQAESLEWNGCRHYYAHGMDSSGMRRLVEVFVVGPQALLEPLPAFQYPKPFREIFPEDYAVLYSDDPWGVELADSEQQ